MIDAAKAATVNHLMLSKEEVRCALFDSIIQPVPHD
jgi:hypothetical protein